MKHSNNESEKEQRECYVDELVICVLCQRLLSDPRLLECLHTFCLSCLESKYNWSAGSRIECPICGITTAVSTLGLSDLEKNVFLDALLLQKNMQILKSGRRNQITCNFQSECKVKATHYCEDECGFLCEACTDNHSKLKITMYHKIDVITNYSIEKRKNRFPQCHSHTKDTLQFFCLSCKKMCCCKCLFLLHKDHETLLLDEGVAKDVCDAERKDLMVELVSLLRQVKMCENETRSSNENAEKCFIKVEENINAVASDMKKQIDQWELCTMQNIRMLRITKTKEVKAVRNKQEDTTRFLRDLSTRAQTTAKHGTTCDVLSHVEASRLALSKMQSRGLPSFECDNDIAKITLPEIPFICDSYDVSASVSTHNHTPTSGSRVKEINTFDMHISSTPMYPHKSRKVTGITRMGEYIYAIDSNPPTLQTFTKTGEFMTCAVVKSNLHYPCCLIALPSLNVLVTTDWSKHLPSLLFLERHNADNNFNLKATKKLNYRPGAVTLDTSDPKKPKLLVADPENHMIQFHSISGQQLKSLQIPKEIVPWKILVNLSGSEYLSWILTIKSLCG